MHGLSYGHDCVPLKAFINALDPAKTSGVAVLSRGTTDDEITKLHRGGVRGIRLDLYVEGAMHDLEKQRNMLSFFAERIRPWGWNMAFLQLEAANWGPLSKLISGLPVRVIVDHHALLKAKSMLPAGVIVTEQPGLAAIVSMLKLGNLWVKLSAPYRCSEQSPHYGDMQELVRCLVDANPHRVVWGSDW